MFLQSADDVRKECEWKVERGETQLSRVGRSLVEVEIAVCAGLCFGRGEQGSSVQRSSLSDCNCGAERITSGDDWGKDSTYCHVKVRL